MTVESLTEKELAEAKARFDNIQVLRGRYKNAMADIETLKKHSAPGQKWPVEIILKSGNNYRGEREVSVKVIVTYEVACQQLLYRIQDAKRALIHAGGKP